MSVTLEIHVTSRYELVPGELPVVRVLRLVDAAEDFLEELNLGNTDYCHGHIPDSCWIADQDPEASSAKKTQNAYGLPLIWTTAGEIARMPAIEEEIVYPLDRATMAFLRQLGADNPGLLLILEMS